MTSPISTRLYHVYRKAGHPLPTFDDDDVVNYMVTEAVVLKVMKEEQEQEKKQKREDWKRDPDGMADLKQRAAAMPVHQAH